LTKAADAGLPVAVRSMKRLGVIFAKRVYFLGMLMICAESPAEAEGGSALRKNLGATFHRCPFSVVTVTV